MALDARNFKVTGQWARGASTAIPPIPVSGQAYRNAGLTQSDAEAGQAYDVIWESARNNQKDFEATGIAGQASRYGIVVWTPLEDYVAGSIQTGTDAQYYVCVKAHGPNTADAESGETTGPKDPANPANRGVGKYWLTLADWLTLYGGLDVGGDGLPRPYGEDGTVLTVLDQAGGVLGWRAASVAQNQALYESSGTFTAPATGWYKVTAVGGGGGGSGGFASPTYGCGGGSGGSGYVITKSVYLTKGMTYPIAIGSGGGGGSPVFTSVAAQAGNGYDGGTTSFGGAGAAYRVEAPGGTGGIGGSYNGSAHITSSSGTGLCKGVPAIYGSQIGLQYIGGYPLFGYFANNKPLGYGLGGTGGFGKPNDGANTTAGTAGQSGLLIVEW